MSERIGTLIKRLRTERGLTQRAFARLIGMNHTYLSKMENGRLDTVPSQATIQAMASALDVDPDWLSTQCGRVPEPLTRQVAVNPEFVERLGRLHENALAAIDDQRPFRLVGQIPAGPVSEAIEDIEEFHLSSVFSPDEHYLLKVRGDSMIDDGIHDGDLAIIRPQPDCRDGDIVVALIDGQEATLKRFYREGRRIRLQPANETMQPIYIGAERLEIRGKLVGILRTRV